MSRQSPRIRAIPAEEFDDRQKAAVGKWGVLNISRVLAHHPELYRHVMGLIGQLIVHSTLPPRDREILVLRALGVCGEEYETFHHTLIARKAGMSDAEIEAARTGGPGLQPFERRLVDAAEELLRDHRISDATWEALAQRYSTAQLVELVLLVGVYAALGLATRTLDVEIEDETAIRQLAELREYT